MRMNSIHWQCGVLLVSVAIFGFAGPSRAQDGRSIQTGPDGTAQLAPHVPADCGACLGKKVAPCTTCDGGKTQLATKCPECTGKKVTTCRLCLGFGQTYDSLLYVKCTNCDARGFQPCPMCDGTLKLKTTGGDPGPACATCDKKGSWKCVVCKGQKWLKLEHLDTKPLEQGTFDELTAFKKRVTPILDATKKYADKDDRRLLADYAPMMDKFIAVFPCFKDEPKHCRMLWETVDKKQKNLADLNAAKGQVRSRSAWAAYAHAFAQIRAIDNCLAVHEQNKKTADKAAKDAKAPPPAKDP